MLPGFSRQFVYCYPLDQYFYNRFLDDTTLVGTTDKPEEYATALLGNKTVEWLRDNAIPAAKAGTPFFAYVPLHPPHGNTQVSFVSFPSSASFAFAHTGCVHSLRLGTTSHGPQSGGLVKITL